MQAVSQSRVLKPCCFDCGGGVQRLSCRALSSGGGSEGQKGILRTLLDQGQAFVDTTVITYATEVTKGWSKLGGRITSCEEVVSPWTPGERNPLRRNRRVLAGRLRSEHAFSCAFSTCLDSLSHARKVNRLSACRAPMPGPPQWAPRGMVSLFAMRRHSFLASCAPYLALDYPFRPFTLSSTDGAGKTQSVVGGDLQSAIEGDATACSCGRLCLAYCLMASKAVLEPPQVG
jgi:hypothetical protein